MHLNVLKLVQTDATRPRAVTTLGSTTTAAALLLLGRDIVGQLQLRFTCTIFRYHLTGIEAFDLSSYEKIRLASLDAVS